MPVRSPRTLRILGFVTILCGLFLILMMGLLLHWMGDMLAHPGERTTAGSTFNGTADQAWWIVRLFWTILGFGIVAAAAGVWQMVTGRRDRLAVILVLVAFAVVAFMTWRTVSLIR